MGLESLKFSEYDAVQALANFIDRAGALEFLDIEYQNDSRPISITGVPATSSDLNDGSITITDYNTGEVIVTQASSKT